MVYFAFKKIFLTVNFHKGSFGYVEHSKLTKLLQKLFIPTFFTVSKKGIKKRTFFKGKVQTKFYLHFQFGQLAFRAGQGLAPVPFRQLGGQVEQVLHGANPHVQGSAAVVHHLWYLDRPVPHLWFVHVIWSGKTKVTGVGSQLLPLQKGFGNGCTALPIPHGTVHFH